MVHLIVTSSEKLHLCSSYADGVLLNISSAMVKKMQQILNALKNASQKKLEGNLKQKPFLCANPYPNKMLCLLL